MTEFTRYLYLKEEVEVAMLMSLLHGDKERALFWAYELYYSGLVDALLLSLWRIYYEFYAMLNPALETYLKKKQTEIASKEEIIRCFLRACWMGKRMACVWCSNF